MLSNGKLNGVKIEDTYAELFGGLVSRLLFTGERGLTKKDTKSPNLEYDPLRYAAYRGTSTPATVVGRPEAGIEKWVPKNDTPDGREGVVVQYWIMRDGRIPLEEQVKKFNEELSIRIRQDVLSASGGTIKVFDCMPAEESIFDIDTEERVGKCGGGKEKFLKKYGARKIINVPLMMGMDFEIENRIKVGKSPMGANFWVYCDSVKTGRKAGRAAIEAIKCVDGVITPFYICPSGSSAENYPPIGPPTNYRFCPTLRNKISNSLVPKDVKSIPEIVIDGIGIEAMGEAMKRGIYAASLVKGVKQISAGNYEGKLGKQSIHLRKLF
jgi:formylmethanofuran--tetrahydromethanopterin N-formyltransferase